MLYLALVVVPIAVLVMLELTVFPSMPFFHSLSGKWDHFSGVLTAGGTIYIIWFAFWTYTLWNKVYQI